jgi:hypothetical protein
VLVGAVVGAVAVTGTATGVLAVAGTGAATGVLAVAGTGAATGALTVAIAGALTGAVAIAGALTVAGAVAIAGALTGAVVETGAATGAAALAGVLAVAGDFCLSRSINSSTRVLIKPLSFDELSLLALTNWVISPDVIPSLMTLCLVHAIDNTTTAIRIIMTAIYFIMPLFIVVIIMRQLNYSVLNNYSMLMRA